MNMNKQIKSVWRWLGRYGRDRRGNISTMVALLIVPLVGVMGVATETGSWLLIQRSAQNAADSAVVAAATNGTGIALAANQTYVQEGRGVAANFGFVNGASNTTVTVTYPDNTVPGKCNNRCYAVTITRNMPIYLNRIVGYTGVGGMQSITARAVAAASDNPTQYCLVSLGGGSGSFSDSGGNSVDLHGCNVLANGDVTCNGSKSNGGANSITYGPGGANNKKCSPAVQESSTFGDPYSGQSSQFPNNTCGGSYPGQNINTPQDLTAALTGKSYPGKIYCGNVKLTANVTATVSSPGSLLVIENGTLDLNGYTLSTTGGGGLTIVFTGGSGGLASPGGNGLNGTFQYSAPTTGAWRGYAMYQDSTMPVISTDTSGNSMNWNISGMIYLPVTKLGFGGTVNKNGLDCFVLVDYWFQSHGTGNILENQSQCIQQGVSLPQSATSKRTALIY